MANILIHGVDKKKWPQMRRRIMKMFKTTKISREIALTFVKSYVAYDDHIAPYLEVRSTSKEEITAVVQALKAGNIAMDVETILLHSFHPADEMQPS